MICTVSIECTVYSVVHRKRTHVLCVTASLLFAPPSPPPPGQRERFGMCLWQAGIKETKSILLVLRAFRSYIG